MSIRTQTIAERDARRERAKALARIAESSGVDVGQVACDRLRIEQAIALVRQIEPRSIDPSPDIGRLHLAFALSHLRTLAAQARHVFASQHR